MNRSAIMCGALQRAPVRATLSLPQRRPVGRPPKIHPGTGMPLTKSRGQHLIHNVGVVHKMVQAADLRSFDVVYEVGCATGELTQMPMPRRFDVCVSNLPYQISSPFIFRLMKRLTDGPPWRSAVLMLQKEFAERLLADPGEKNFSRLALNTRLFVRATRCFDVRPGSFIPEPMVHSCVVRLEPRQPLPTVDFLEWDALIRILFSRRRKTLRAQLTKLSTISMLEQNYKVRCSLAGVKPSRCPFPELVESVLREGGFGGERAFCMDIEDLYCVLQAFNGKGIYFVNVHSSDDLPSLLGGGIGEDCQKSLRISGAAPASIADSGLGPLRLLRPTATQQQHCQQMQLEGQAPALTYP